MIVAATCPVPFIGDPCQSLSDLWSNLWAPISDNWPLWWSWGVFIGIVLAIIALGTVIRLLLPSDWAKFPLLTLFVGLVGMIGWIIGSQTMHTKMKARLDAERERKRESSEPTDGGGWWPFNR